MKAKLTTPLLTATLLLAASQVEARPPRVSQIPNAPAACGTCHIDPQGGGPRNPFGQDVESTLIGSGADGVVDWSAVFDLDSDGDGFTNGEELGDPNGAWSTGDPSPSGAVSRPGDPDSTIDIGDDQGGCTTTSGDTLFAPLLSVGAFWFARRRKPRR